MVTAKTFILNQCLLRCFYIGGSSTLVRTEQRLILEHCLGTTLLFYSRDILAAVPCLGEVGSNFRIYLTDVRMIDGHRRHWVLRRSAYES